MGRLGVHGQLRLHTHVLLAGGGGDLPRRRHGVHELDGPPEVVGREQGVVLGADGAELRVGEGDGRRERVGLAPRVGEDGVAGGGVGARGEGVREAGWGWVGRWWGGGWRGGGLK